MLGDSSGAEEEGGVDDHVDDYVDDQRSAEVMAAKTVLRAQMLAARRARSAAEREQAGQQLAARAGALASELGAQRVACYVSFGTEPPTQHVLERLAADGVRVLVPIVRADLDLDWAIRPGAQAAAVAKALPGAGMPGAAAAEGSQDASVRRCGPAAISTVDLVLVPALAVSTSGARLGRGGGSYDRALARVPPAVPIVAVVYDEELVDQLPTEEHDRPVDLALTPTRLVRLGHLAG